VPARTATRSGVRLYRKNTLQTRRRRTSCSSPTEMIPSIVRSGISAQLQPEVRTRARNSDMVEATPSLPTLTAGAPPGFHLLSKPSGSTCNIDCTYCFFLSKEALYPNDKQRMSDRTLEDLHPPTAGVTPHTTTDRTRLG